MNNLSDSTYDTLLKRNQLPEFLFEKINIVEPYPEMVAPVIRMADITAFFPGGRGLWQKDNSDIFPDILILGHDFSTEKWYMQMIAGLQEDLDSPTWLNIIKLFGQAGLDLNRCFFSNAFMGLRKTESMIGEFPGFKDKAFVKRNIEFLSFQICTIKPKLIITLGKYAAELLSKEAGADLIPWRIWQALKEPDVGLVSSVRFKGHTSMCLALEHPSMRNSNVKRRRYNGYFGNDAEVMMIKSALAF